VGCHGNFLFINFDTYIDKYMAYYYNINKLAREG